MSHQGAADARTLALREAEVFLERSNPAHTPFWLDEVPADSPDSARLEGSLDADVCVVGGGYVGLWTAIRLREIEPSRRVVLIEADRCGHAASGRNGGLALSWWMKIQTLVKRFGASEAFRLARQSVSAIEEVEKIAGTDSEGSHFARHGYVYAATCPAQLGAWEKTASLISEAGEDAILESLTHEDIVARFGTHGYLAGVRETCAANLQPARLLHALERKARQAGVEIYEHSPLTRLDRDRGILHTPHGEVHATAIALALNAWLHQARGFRRRILPLGSYLSVTEPVPELLEESGWTERCGINGMAMMESGFDRTRDGRVKFSYRSGTLSFAGRIVPSFYYDRDAAIRGIANLHRLFPSLRDARITHAWGGVVDRSRDGLPFHGRLPGGVPIAYAAGFSGNGVVPSVISGRILASSAIGREDEWSAHPLNAGKPSQWLPPEPIRFLGGTLVRRSMRRKDEAEADGATASRVTVSLASLAPKGFR